VWYVVNFTMTAPDAAHTMLVFLEQVSHTVSAGVARHQCTDGERHLQLLSDFSGDRLYGQWRARFPDCEYRGGHFGLQYYVIPGECHGEQPDQNVFFQYNATKSSVSLGLSGTYQDATGATYSGTVTIPAYGSILLFKKT
jgi:hypothetical protein